MTDRRGGDAISESLAAASTSLRETAKWLVGGVAVTAAGVFAGSSLTNLGSLTLPDDWPRIAVAVIGAVAGFASIGDLAWRALEVLTIRSQSFRQLADAEEPSLKLVVAALEERYASSFLAETGTLAGLKARIERENEKESGSRDAAFLTSAESFLPILMAEASFQRVHDQFDRLKRVLPVRLLGAVIGFGLFAWAANPPAPPSPTPLLVLHRA